MAPPPATIAVAAAPLAAVTCSLAAPSPPRAGRSDTRLRELRADRPGAERALEAAQDLTRRPRRAHRPRAHARARRARRPPLGAEPSDRDEADELLARPTDAGDAASPAAPTPVRDAEARLHGALLHPLGRADRRTPRRSRRRRREPDAGLRRPDDAHASSRRYDVENGQLGWRAAGARRHARRRRARPTSTSRSSTATSAAASTATRPSTRPDRRRPPSAFLVHGRRLRGRRVPRLPGDPDDPAAGHGGARVQPRAPVRLRRLPGHLDVRVDGDVDGGQGLRRRQRLPTSTWPTWARVAGAADHRGDPARTASRCTARPIWNHWLERRYGADVVRRAWELSVATTDDRGFAPGAYDAR